MLKGRSSVTVDYGEHILVLDYKQIRYNLTDRDLFSTDKHTEGPAIGGLRQRKYGRMNLKV